MKFTSVVAALFAASVVVAQDDGEATSATAIETISVSSSTTNTHRWGRFDKTRASSTPTSSGTHRWGRFDKTHAASTSTSSGTHRWGRFDKTNNKAASTANDAALAKMSSSFLIAGVAAYLL